MRPSVPKPFQDDVFPTANYRPAVVRMQLLDSHSAAPAQGTDRLPGVANYFLGNDVSQCGRAY
jgi:hypothetical protein